MATYTLGPTTAKQDQILARIAAKRGVTVQAMIDGELARIFARAKNEYEMDEGVQVAAAYQAAGAALQASVRSALGVP